MGPCVHSNVVISLKRVSELSRTTEDVHANHKMSGGFVVSLQKVNKPGCKLYVINISKVVDIPLEL